MTVIFDVQGSGHRFLGNFAQSLERGTVSFPWSVKNPSGSEGFRPRLLGAKTRDFLVTLRAADDSLRVLTAGREAGAGRLEQGEWGLESLGCSGDARGNHALWCASVGGVQSTVRWDLEPARQEERNLPGVGLLSVRNPLLELALGSRKAGLRVEESVRVAHDGVGETAGYVLHWNPDAVEGLCAYWGVRERGLARLLRLAARIAGSGHFTRTELEDPAHRDPWKAAASGEWRDIVLKTGQDPVFRWDGGTRGWDGRLRIHSRRRWGVVPATDGASADPIEIPFVRIEGLGWNGRRPELLAVFREPHRKRVWAQREGTFGGAPQPAVRKGDEVVLLRNLASTGLWRYKPLAPRLLDAVRMLFGERPKEGTSPSPGHSLSR